MNRDLRISCPERVDVRLLVLIHAVVEHDSIVLEDALVVRRCLVQYDCVQCVVRLRWGQQ